MYKHVHVKYMCRLYCIKFPCSRGVSGALYLQSAIAGVMPIGGFHIAELPLISGNDERVLRNRSL